MRASAILAFALAGCAALPTGHDFYKPTAQCPPGDRADWRYEPTWPRAKEIVWITLDSPAFARTCNPKRLASMTGRSVVACAGGIGEDGLGVIYATIPRAIMSEAIRVHEECHMLQWNHDSLEEERWSDYEQ